MSISWLGKLSQGPQCMSCEGLNSAWHVVGSHTMTPEWVSRHTYSKPHKGHPQGVMERHWFGPWEQGHYTCLFQKVSENSVTLPEIWAVSLCDNGFVLFPHHFSEVPTHLCKLTHSGKGTAQPSNMSTLVKAFPLKCLKVGSVYT